MATTLDGAPAIETLTLPAEGVGAARQGGASILAYCVRDAAGRIVGLAVARRRRSSVMMRVTRFEADDASAPLLAQALLKAAGDTGVIEIRATADLPQAMAALGMTPGRRGYAQRWLIPPIAVAADVGAFNQTTGFTCGPVSLAMAIGANVTRSDEVAIWREATTMIGLTGPGGCDPYGLALATRRRAGDVTLFIDTEEPVLLDRANTEEKRDLMRFVQHEFKRRALDELTIVPRRLSIGELREAVAGGGRVLLLIDQCHTHDHNAPHWVLVHAVADNVFLVNDPWVETEDGEVPADTDCTPVIGAALDRMACYGAPPYSAAIVIGAA